MDTSLIRKKIIEDEEDEEEPSVDLPGTAESTFCCGGGILRSASKDQVSFLCMSLVLNSNMVFCDPPWPCAEKLVKMIFPDCSIYPSSFRTGF